jgi:hypothetical protein
LRTWSEPVVVNAGGSAAAQTNWFGGDCECPFVVRRSEAFYLFRNQRYGADALNTQYASSNPLDFGVDDDRCRVGSLPIAAPEIVEADDRTYAAHLLPSLKGIAVTELEWVEAEG